MMQKKISKSGLPGTLKKQLRAIASMGMAFIVLGVLMLASSYIFNVESNILLFAGLIFIVAGTTGYVYSLKK